MTNLLTKQQIIEKYQNYPSFQELNKNNPNDYQFVDVYDRYDGPISGVMLYNGKLCFFLRTILDYHIYLSNDFEKECTQVDAYTVYKIPKQILPIIKQKMIIFQEMFGKNISYDNYGVENGKEINISIKAWDEYKKICSEIGVGVKTWIKECITWKKVGTFKFDIEFDKE